MNISIIGPTYPYKGGISQFMTVLAQHLSKNHTINFLSWKIQYPSFLYPVDQKDNSTKMIVDIPASYPLNFYNPFSWLKTAHIIKKSNTDTLIITWVTPVQAPIYIVICMAMRIISKKTEVVYLCHNALPHERKFYDVVLTKGAFYFGDKFITHSQQDYDAIMSMTKSKKVVHAFLPIFDFFNTDELPDVTKVTSNLKLKKNVILFFGYVRPYKGLIHLVRAMQEIVKESPNTTLLIVGEFWSHDKADYVKEINDLGLKNNVVIVDGYVPNEEVASYFYASDVVVCPYISGTQSGIIQMAYALDKPVIATKVGGLMEAVQDNVSGILIEPSSETEIVQAVARFYDDQSKYSVANVKNTFSWDRYIRTTIV